VGGEHGADDDHHGGHPEGAARESLLASELVDADEQEDGGGDDLDSPVDSGGEEGGVCFADTDGLKDLRGVCGCED